MSRLNTFCSVCYPDRLIRVMTVSGFCDDSCRIDKLELTFGALSGDSGNWLNGKASAADLLRFENSMHLPMLHAPGAQYCYVNTNFNIAGYVVEKVSEP